MKKGTRVRLIFAGDSPFSKEGLPTTVDGVLEYEITPFSVAIPLQTEKFGEVTIYTETSKLVEIIALNIEMETKEK